MAWTVGLPFLAVAATAPLVQQMVRGQRPSGGGRPVLPLRSEQSRQRARALVLSAAGRAAPDAARAGPRGPPATARWCCWPHRLRHGRLARGSAGAGRAGDVPAAPSAEAIGWPRRLRWLALALVPSGLLLAVTTHITTDLAAVPLLWVVPLALYLLTFVIAFARRPWLRHAWMLKAQPFVLIPLVLLFAWTLPFWLVLPLHLLCLFVSALVCHGELARTAAARRAPDRVLLLAGARRRARRRVHRAARAAPVRLACSSTRSRWPPPACCGRALAPEAGRRALDFLLPLAIGALIAARGARPRSRPAGLRHDRHAAGVRAERRGCCTRWPSARCGFGLGIAAALGGGAADRRRAHRGRAASAASSASTRSSAIPPATTCWSTARRCTARRASIRRAGASRSPTTIATGRSGICSAQLGARAARRRRGGPRRRRGRLLPPAGAALDLLRDRSAGRADRPRSAVFPLSGRVRARCRDPCRGCPPHAAGRAPASYDLLILDAFSSDAIPMHLITREALALYLDKLAPGGVIAWHVSNRNLDLAPIVARSRRRCRRGRLGAVGSAIARRARRLSQPVLLDRARTTCRGPGAAGRRCRGGPGCRAGPTRGPGPTTSPTSSARCSGDCPAEHQGLSRYATRCGRRRMRTEAGFEARLGANWSFRRGTRRQLGRPRHRGSGRASARGRGHHSASAPSLQTYPRPPRHGRRSNGCDDPGSDAALPGITARSC